jgi:hypothetical protein
MAKLDIIPFEVKIEPVAAYMNGIVYEDIKIDKDEMITELENSFGRSLSFAVEITYVNSDTINYIIGKAGSHEKALETLVGSGEEVKKGEKNVEAPVVEEVEETKEEKKESNETNTEDKSNGDSSE